MKLVCWDYNGTIAQASNARPNIKEVLTDLKQTGHTSVITSSIPEQSIESQLPKIGIDGLIAKVYGNKTNRGFNAKHYQDVLKDQGLALNQASQNAVIIGDNERDHPGDLEKVVFIYNPDGSSKTDARVVKKLIDDLYQSGNSHFYRGFERFKTTGIDLEEECGFVYHGQLVLPEDHKGIVLSAFNGNPWTTPTVLLIPKDRAKQFEQFEVKS